MSTNYPDPDSPLTRIDKGLDSIDALRKELARVEGASPDRILYMNEHLNLNERTLRRLRRKVERRGPLPEEVE